MSLNLRPNDKRERLAELRREIAAITAETPEERKARRAMAKARRDAVKQSQARDKRQPREHDKPYLAFVRRQPCMICGTTRAVEAAHVRCGYPEAGWRSTGMQEKPNDRRTLPLCADHHREGPKAQHRAGERQWWAAHGIYPPDACAALERLYEGVEEKAITMTPTPSDLPALLGRGREDQGSSVAESGYDGPRAASDSQCKPEGAP